MKINKRKVKIGKAKDYQRNAKYYDYYYIVVDNNNINLHMNGWSEFEPIRKDDNGDFVIVEGTKYYLDYTNIYK